MQSLLDGGFEEPKVDLCDLLISSCLGSIRGQLSAAMNEMHVGVREVARRLNVSPSAVSRHLNAEGDMRVSTMLMLGYALGLEWQIKLQNTLHQSRYSAIMNATEAMPPTLTVEPSLSTPVKHLPHSGTYAPSGVVNVILEAVA